MDIFLDAQTGVNESPAFSLSFEPEALMLQSVGDMVSFNVQSAMLRGSAFWSKAERQNFVPIVLALHGLLYSPTLFQGNQGWERHWLPRRVFHSRFQAIAVSSYLLSFHCTRSYLKNVEEQRSANPGPTVSLSLSLWSTVVLLSSTNQSMLSQSNFCFYKTVTWDRISLFHDPTGLTCCRLSALLKGELSSFRSLVTQQEDSEELKSAIAHVNEAYALFAQDRYREAVQRCRQARDALLGEDKKTWPERTLLPIIGLDKAATISESIKALNNGNVASHGANIEVDRDVAEYVLSSLTLILQYLLRKFR